MPNRTRDRDTKRRRLLKEMFEEDDREEDKDSSFNELETGED